MAHLTIQLLGPFRVRLDGEPVARFESAKAGALLAYLAAEPERPQPREALAEMFWPDRPEGAARANLRHTLAHLRRVIADSAAQPPLLLPKRHTIQFNQSSDAWIDVSACSSLLSTQSPAPSPPNLQTLLQLEEAMDLHQGPFLEDLSLADSSAFEEWRAVRRERFSRLALSALAGLTEGHEEVGEYERALRHANVRWTLNRGTKRPTGR